MTQSPTAWNDPRSYAPDLYESISHPRKVGAAGAGIGFAGRPEARKSAAIIASHFPAAALGFLAGMMATVGLALVWSLFL